MTAPAETPATRQPALSPVLSLLSLRARIASVDVESAQHVQEETEAKAGLQEACIPRRCRALWKYDGVGYDAGRNSPRSGAFGLQILTPGGCASPRNPHVLPRVLCLPSTAVGLRAEPLVFRVHSRLRPFAFLPLLEPTSGAGTTSFCPCCRGMGAISTAPRMARAPIISRICPSRTTAGDTR